MSPASVLVVGFDAADPDILQQMAADGRLPTVASLLEQGARMEVRNPVGLYVGALWTSFTTALTPGRHGRYSPRQLVPGTYEARPMPPSEIHGRPFWGALAAAGQKVAVVDVPHTAPVEGMADVQIVEWGAHDPAVGLSTWPPSLADELVDRFGDHPIHGDDRTCDDAQTPDEFRAGVLDAVPRRAELARFLLDEDQWDLFVTVFSESHCAVHQCWHLRDEHHPNHDPDVARRTGDVIEQVYVALDGALRDLLAACGDDTTVLLLASHGAKPHYDGTFLLDQVLRRFEAAEMPAWRRWRRTWNERRWANTPRKKQWRHARAHDRVWRGFEELMPLDPATRPCFKIDNNEPYGGIRVNLVGREPRGRIEPSEFDDFCTRLTRDLLELVNLETGRPLVRRVVRTAEEYEGDQVRWLPDLLVEWDWSAPVRSIASPKLGRIDGTYSWTRTGDHRPDGLLVARGPRVCAGALPPIDVTDIGPTVAAMLGVHLDGVDGRAVDSLVGERLP